VRDVFAEARLRDAEAANPTPDHAHQFVAQRCMVCGCGEPENDHGDPTLLTIDTTDGVAACPQCGELSQGKTVSNLWMPGMTCP
ncbi:hypothetical protein, partial [Pseudomonas aeruginosa]|uniref:hypothetical protein n=1 Tax=Pseudomonas aeruginosa TaxID=287 RepID=UPI002F95B6A2